MAAITLTQAANDACNLLSVLDSGEGLSATQLQDALRAANNLLDNWYNEQVELLTLIKTSFVLVGGTLTPGAVPQFANTTTPLTLPTGYLRAFVAALAIELAPQYAAKVSAELAAAFKESRIAAQPLLASLLANAPTATKMLGG